MREATNVYLEVYILHIKTNMFLFFTNTINKEWERESNTSNGGWPCLMILMATTKVGGGGEV